MKNLLLLAISLPLLLGGCGEKPVADVNPELEGVNTEELEERDGIAYLKDSALIYQGKSHELYPNGELKAVYTYKDGILWGLMTTWYINGQKEVKVNFKIGQADGLAVEWHENGQKKEEGNYKDGELISAKFWNNQGEPVSYKEVNKE